VKVKAVVTTYLANSEEKTIAGAVPIAFWNPAAELMNALASVE
jgi:hypothetical protein